MALEDDDDDRDGDVDNELLLVLAPVDDNDAGDDPEEPRDPDFPGNPDPGAGMRDPPPTGPVADPWVVVSTVLEALTGFGGAILLEDMGPTY